MMKPFISFSFLLLFLWCVSAQTTSTATDGDKRYYVPEGWEDAGVSGPLDVHDVIFAVKYDVEDERLLDQTFEAVSNPKSERFRKYLTAEELADAMSPSADKVQTVVEWLSPYAEGEITLSGKGAFVHVSLSSDSLRTLIGVEMHRFRNKQSGYTVSRSPIIYSLPPHIDRVVDIIADVVDFPPRRLSSRVRNIQSLSSSSSNSSAPLPAIVQGSSDTWFVQVYPLCAGGQTPSTSSNLCAEFNDPIVAFNISLTPIYVNGENNKQFHYTVDDFTCMVEGKPLCNIALSTPNLSYQQATISVSSIFSSKTNSETTTFPFNMTLTPWITPDLARDVYNIPQGAGRKAFGDNAQGVVEFDTQFYNPDDFATWCSLMGIREPTVQDIGENDPNSPGVESMSDIEWIVAMAPGIPSVFWWSKGGFLGWAAAANNASSVPYSFSISYDATDAINLPLVTKYQARIDTEFQKLGVRGVSIVVGSGDGGATNIGHGARSCDKMHPLYPTSSPYVLSVGGTRLSKRADPVCYSDIMSDFNTDCDRVGEVMIGADNGIFWTTGGGFSDRTPTQSWQNATVAEWAKYVPKSHLPPTGEWNPNGRAYPDISALGHNLMLYIDGELMPIDGTSLAGPIVAGMLSLVNNELFKRGKPSVGFINPFLYSVYDSAPSVFTDITVGDNRCGAYDASGTYPLCCPSGYYSEPGWDPVSGLGTLNLAQLIAHQP